MRSLLVPRIAVLLGCLVTTVYAAHSAEVGFRTPTTAISEQSVELVERVQRAVVTLYNACRLHDQAGVEAILTPDGVVDYRLERMGTYLAADAAGLSATCEEGAADFSSASTLVDLWIFPTADANTVFIQYRSYADQASAGQLSDHLAVVEMRGDRISKLRHLTGTAPERLSRFASSRMRD
jgi:hypothetical protein